MTRLNRRGESSDEAAVLILFILIGIPILAWIVHCYGWHGLIYYLVNGHTPTEVVLPR